MTKLKLLSLRKIEDMPDYLIEEIRESSIKLVMHMQPIIGSMSPNVALNALQWANAVFIKELITNDPEELRKAARWAARELLRNIETAISELEKEK